MTEFVFEESAWEQALKELTAGDTLSAAKALLLMEAMSDEEAEEALLMLEEQGITLDISDLPLDSGSGEAALRLRQEQQMAKSGLTGLDENDPLGLYLQELAELPVTGDVQLLAEQYAAGKEDVLQNLTNLCLSRVVETACKHTGRGILLLDLIQEGSLGLWQGILRYTEGDFEVYIQWWIQQYMAKAALMQARSSGIGEKMRTALEDYRDMDQQLLGELGRNPTLEEIAEAIHITPEEAATVAEMLTQAKLRQQTVQAREPKEETPEDNQAVEDTAYFQARQRVLDMLSTLSEQEAKLLTLRFGLDGGLPKTAQQAGEILGLTAEEAVNMEAAALSKLRK